MVKKIVLSVLFSGLLISGFFYWSKGPGDTETFYFKKGGQEDIINIADKTEVLGQETELSTEDRAEGGREFAGCRKEQININIASAEGLKEIEGIGPVLSQRIIEERQNGPFYSVYDLTRVSGIGEGIIGKIKEQDLACAGSLKEGSVYLPLTEKDSQQKEDPVTEKERSFSGCRDGQININSADKDLLQKIVQIGPSRAEQIILLRQENSFYSLEDLELISGIAGGTLSQIKEQDLACADHPDQVFFTEPDPEPEADSETEPEPEPQFEGCRDGQINLNSAPKEDLMEIVQIGPSYSDQIIELRQQEWFWSVEDLARVSGISLDGSRLQDIIEQDLACAADPEDASFEPFLKTENNVSFSPKEESSLKKEPSISLVYAEENPVDKEIKVWFSALNLENAVYDIKLSIEKDGVLSRIYNKETSQWASSNFYLTEVFSGTSFEGEFLLKIREEELDFEGEADIIVRVRENGKSGYLAEFKGKIIIIGPEETKEEEADKEKEPLPGPTISLSYSEFCPVDQEIEVSLFLSDLEYAVYDLKISIEKEGALSQICKTHYQAGEDQPCSEKEELWQNSFNYLDSVFEDTGLEGNFLLRIREDKNDFRGEADIIARVRENGKSGYLAEFKGKVNIIDPEKEFYPDPEPEPDPVPEFEGCQDNQINLNAAHKEELTEIIHIGPSYADQIIELRQQEWFWSVEDLARVSGISLDGSRLQDIIEQDLACAADPN